VAEPLSVLRDGRAVQTGKGRTGIRSRHRNQGPNRQERTPKAHRPAGTSAAGGKSKGPSVPPPLAEIFCRRLILPTCALPASDVAV